ncbi:hypothetical protein PAPHI01_2467 [Pancytospora philotis]|nr:hypothetical protein PAPHI01_2461 [Pancytospora philotis]KAI4293193.1 hypothetical protein PAPHI01_2467 [Pancytospora philotis]
MVENDDRMRDLKEKVACFRITRLRREMLEQDLVALQLRRGWEILPNGEKIKTAVAEAEYHIRKWYLRREADNPKETWVEFRMALEAEFLQPKMSVGVYARQHRGKNETVAASLQRMEDLEIEIGVPAAMRMEHTLEGLRAEDFILKTHLLTHPRITRDVIRLIVRMEANKPAERQPRTMVGKRTTAMPQLLLPKHINEEPLIRFVCDAAGHYADDCPKKAAWKVRDMKRGEQINDVNSEDHPLVNNKQCRNVIYYSCQNSWAELRKYIYGLLY